VRGRAAIRATAAAALWLTGANALSALPVTRLAQRAIPDKKAPESEKAERTKALQVAPLPPRSEHFQKIGTLRVGGFAIDLCRRADGAFGLGEIRRGARPVRRADFLVTWQVDGRFPVFEQRQGLIVSLRRPTATLMFAPERRVCAGTVFVGFRMRFTAGRGPIVETASWEPGGSTHGLSYFDGYRGWHAPPEWQRADAVPPTNPKLMPSLLHGTGFQFEYGADRALIHFHTSPGDRLRNASCGQALEFQTTFHGPTTIDRYIYLTSGDSRINLWSRAYEFVYAELRRAWGLPEPTREITLQWPPFSRKGFRETAADCTAATARDGFTAASLDVIWDNLEFHGGQKNMNVWDYVVCPGYGGESGLRALMDECKKRRLRVIAWAPAGHLNPASPVWKQHPDWALKNDRGDVFQNPSGLWHGDLDTGFHDYFRDRVGSVVRRFGLDGLWLDTHLAYAGQTWDRPNSAKLAAIYRSFIQAGARRLVVEGDASAMGSYGIGIDDDWGKIPEPDLFYGSTMMAGSTDPRFYQRHFRQYVASGAPWTLDWDFLYSAKLTGDAIAAARQEVRRVVQQYRKVKDRMVHRFVHADGSGYTWTNDHDRARVVWLLKDAALPDGQRGTAGHVYVLEPGQRAVPVCGDLEQPTPATPSRPP
jgi:hypothetical protein